MTIAIVAMGMTMVIATGGIDLSVDAVMARTLFDRYVLAIGGNERAAYLAGGPVKATKIGVYVICTALSGLVGLIVVVINSASDAARNGNLMELDAIATAVVGGALLQGAERQFMGPFSERLLFSW